MFWLIALTNNLQTAISMKLADVSGVEPPLAFLIHEEVLTVLLSVLVVTHGYVGPADQNLPSRTGPVCAAISTWIHTDCIMTQKERREMV